jgi:hypothetical protein
MVRRNKNPSLSFGKARFYWRIHLRGRSKKVMLYPLPKDRRRCYFTALGLSGNERLLLPF